MTIMERFTAGAVVIFFGVVALGYACLFLMGAARVLAGYRKDKCGEISEFAENLFIVSVLVIIAFLVCTGMGFTLETFGIIGGGGG